MAKYGKPMVKCNFAMAKTNFGYIFLQKRCKGRETKHTL
jgi:hypothetical protein